MISPWGVDHGADVVSKRLSHYVAGGALGAGAGVAGDQIMRRTDKEYKAKARKDPVGLAAVGGLGGVAGGTALAGPRVGLGLGAGVAGSLYALNRKKKKER